MPKLAHTTPEIALLADGPLCSENSTFSTKKRWANSLQQLLLTTLEILPTPTHKVSAIHHTAKLTNHSWTILSAAPNSRSSLLHLHLELGEGLGIRADLASCAVSPRRQRVGVLASDLHCADASPSNLHLVMG